MNNNTSKTTDCIMVNVYPDKRKIEGTVTKFIVS